MTKHILGFTAEEVNSVRDVFGAIGVPWHVTFLPDVDDRRILIDLLESPLSGRYAEFTLMGNFIRVDRMNSTPVDALALNDAVKAVFHRKHHATIDRLIEWRNVRWHLNDDAPEE